MPREAVGTVSQVAPRGELVVAVTSARGAVPPGAKLVDARRNYVGRVADVIGPVASPFLVVHPPRGGRSKSGPLSLLGKELYPE